MIERISCPRTGHVNFDCLDQIITRRSNDTLHQRAVSSLYQVVQEKKKKQFPYFVAFVYKYTVNKVFRV